MGVAILAERRRGSGRRLALLTLCAANLALVGIIAGGFTVFSDIFAPLAGHLIGIGLAASLAVLTRRMPVLVFGTLATFGLHAWLGLASCCRIPDLPSVATSSIDKNSGAVVAPGMSIVALNTWHANRDPVRLETYLRASQADLAVLSEFGPDKRAMLARLERTYPFQIDCAAEWACSLALLSRVPFESSGSIEASADKPALVWARLGGVTVIGTHLYRPSRDPALHERQVAALVAFINNIPGPVVLAGDLNTTPWSTMYRAFRRSTGLVPASVLRPTWPAWPVAFPQVALDHIFVSPEMVVSGTGTGPAVGSDHLPIWAVVQRRPSFDRGYGPARRFASHLTTAQLHLRPELLADLGSEHARAGNLRR